MNIFEWNIGDVILGEYTIDKELGRGGMGRVWLVRSSSSGHSFAVKQTLLHEAQHREAFLAELQTWIDLPEHPNIVPCRFFRTVGDDVLIFSEFVDGGSLKNWIDSRRLYEGDQRQSLERILDTAIQFAWGLHSIHELGLVHQDVKPGNVLMSSNTETALQGMRVQVSDYGLARARARGGAQEVHAVGEGSIQLSVGGYSPAYCSPEQAKRLSITRKTDLWSWGVSVLEMFTGGVTWHSGHLADAVLDQHLEDADKLSDNLPMPSELVGVLKGCFQNDPAKRWASLGEVVTHLKTAYSKLTGAVYDRELVPIAIRGSSSATFSERHRCTPYGEDWEDPRIILEKGLHLSGRDPSEAIDIINRHSRSWRGHLVADLAIFEYAKNVFMNLGTGDSSNILFDIAKLCMDKAIVHKALGDLSGAAAEFDGAISARKRLLENHEHSGVARDLSYSLISKANVLGQMGCSDRAVKPCDESIALLEELAISANNDAVIYDLANALLAKAAILGGMGNLASAASIQERSISLLEDLESRLKNHDQSKVGLFGIKLGSLHQTKGENDNIRKLIKTLAMAYMTKAQSQYGLGNTTDAIRLYDQSIKNWGLVVGQDNGIESSNHLAQTLMNKANALSRTLDIGGSFQAYDQSIEIYRSILNGEYRLDINNDLAHALMNKANLLNNCGNVDSAVTLYDECIGIWQRLIVEDGKRELARDLAKALVNKANGCYRLNDMDGALRLYDKSIETFRRLIDHEGQRDLKNDLANTLMNKGNALDGIGDLVNAVNLYDQSIEIWKQLYEHEGRRELANDLAGAYMNKGTSLVMLGKPKSAVQLIDQSIDIWQRLVEEEGRIDLIHDMTDALKNKAIIIKQSGSLGGPLEIYSQCTEIHKRLMNRPDRIEFANQLAISLKSAIGLDLQD